MDELRRQFTDKTAKIQEKEASSLSHNATELNAETERKVTAKNGDRLRQLWEYVGEWHRRLSYYFKQVFFDDKPFFVATLPTFETPPARSHCRYWRNYESLDLEGLGIDSKYGLIHAY